jgi:hypothetical protein
VNRRPAVRGWRGADDLATARRRNESTFPRLFPLCGIARPMNDPDQDTLIRAVEDARRILGEYIEPGSRDATRTLEHLLAVLLDRNDVVHALDRMKRRRVIRLVE